jgi:hypothetical protein
MRTALLIATCALTVFAAPIPEAEPIFKSGASGCAKVVGGVCVSTSNRDVEAPTKANIEARFPEPNVRPKKNPRPGMLGTRSPEPAPFTRGSHPPGDAEINTRSPALSRPKGSRSPTLSRPKGSRSSEKRELVYRSNGRRDPEEDEDVEARAIRNEGGSNGKREPIYRPNGRRDLEEDVEARAIRNEGGSNGKREPLYRAGGRRDLEEEDVEARAIKNQGNRSVREKTVSDEDVEARAAEPEAEPLSRNHDSYRRSADPEPAYTLPSDKRDAEPRVRGSN